ncbi:hypothetical protein AVEN_271433-1 [Araneus ventricosus]|uniref:Uncharacterized protein n=1 Tax=Araneus ventricosus TaxID=182803 RepID=A0A4Y2N472_ARAVE|nr:hypothetical protein AVEN_271433-1 [Araneus ventricosus]
MSHKSVAIEEGREYLFSKQIRANVNTIPSDELTDEEDFDDESTTSCLQYLILQIQLKKKFQMEESNFRMWMNTGRKDQSKLIKRRSRMFKI